MAAGSSARLLTTCAPSAEPPWSGLSMSGRPSRSTIASSTACAPSARNVVCGNAIQSGVSRPGAGELGLGGGLVPRPAAGARRGADERARRAAPAPPARSRSRPRRRAARSRPRRAGRRADGPRARRRRPTRARRAPTPRQGRRQPASRVQRRPRARGRCRPPARRARSGVRLGAGSAGAGAVSLSGRPRTGSLSACSATAPAARPIARTGRVAAERVQHVELGLQHPRQPPDALGDPLRRRVAVRQPQLAAAEPVGVEPGARRVGDPRRDRARAASPSCRRPRARSATRRSRHRGRSTCNRAGGRSPARGAWRRGGRGRPRCTS